MIIEHTEMMWLDERHQVNLDELVALSGMSLEELRTLLDSGAIVPCNAETQTKEDELQFSSHYIDTIRTLVRLQQAFELEQNALSLMMVFLERIQNLERELSQQHYLK